MLEQDLDNMALVVAAGSGNSRALDDLIRSHLPLVYSIVGRALNRRADVDDVVQDTMVNLIRGLSGLREPHKFRSWLAAVTMNQIRQHCRRQRPLITEWEESDLPDPGADFVDYTLNRLDLSDQRREAEQAGRWLDEDDRRLLALWWLESAGDLTRAEVIEAMQLNAHHVTVRVVRMKTQLEIARRVMRALAAVPRCPELAGAAAGWHGQPTPLWRKRFARHVRDCHSCLGASSDLVTPEQLQPYMLPLPTGYADYVLQQVVPPDPAVLLRQPPAHHGAPSTVSRLAAKLAAKPVLSAAVFTATVVGGVGAASALSSAPTRTAAPASQPAAAPSATSSSFPASPSTSPSASPKPSLKPALPVLTTSRASASPPKSPAVTTYSGTAVQQALAVMNQARAQVGAAPLTLSTTLTAASQTHNRTMAGADCFSHQCPGESPFYKRETTAGGQGRPTGECIGKGGPYAATEAAMAKFAVSMTQGMLDEKPPNDGHHRIILDKTAAQVGIGLLQDSSGVVWMTMDFST